MSEASCSEGEEKVKSTEWIQSDLGYMYKKPKDEWTWCSRCYKKVERNLPKCPDCGHDFIYRDLESRAHLMLKKIAFSILEKRGFSAKREKIIFIPYEIAPPNHGWKGKYTSSRSRKFRYRVDVYGKRGDEVLMYEVGNTHKIKLDWLNKHIGKTIHMPYITQFCELRR